MPVVPAKVWQRVQPQVSTALVLAALAAIGYAGYANDWSLARLTARWSPEKPSAAEPPFVLVPDPTSQKSADHCTFQWERLEIQFPTKEAAEKMDLQTAKVETRPVHEYVVANGMIDYEPASIAHLTVPVQGSTWRVEKHLGDRVKKGDVLALVRSPEVGKAKAEFKKQLVAVRTQEESYKILQGPNVGKPTLTAAETALREAKIQLVNAQQALLNLGLPIRVEDVEGLSDRELTERMWKLGLPESIARTLDRQIASDNLIPLKAPFDGEVVGRDIVEGEVVGPNMPVQFTVADVREVHIHLDVRLEDIGQVEEGQKVFFQPDDAHEEPVTGIVELVTREVDEKTRKVHVHVHVKNEDGRLLVHSYGTGRIVVRSVDKAVAVPDKAVQTHGPCGLVFVRMSETSVQSRLVHVGIRGDGYTQILSGVMPGEEVVTTGSEALTSQVVRNLPATP